jgi:hypothetical protein
VFLVKALTATVALDAAPHSMLVAVTVEAAGQLDLTE